RCAHGSGTHQSHRRCKLHRQASDSVRAGRKCHVRGSEPRPSDFPEPGSSISDQIFTAFIWGENRGKFPTPPEKAYSGKKICVTGTISSYRGQPQIVVRDPGQITAE